MKCWVEQVGSAPVYSVWTVCENRLLALRAWSINLNFYPVPDNPPLPIKPEENRLPLLPDAGICNCQTIEIKHMCRVPCHTSGHQAQASIPNDFLPCPNDFLYTRPESEPEPELESGFEESAHAYLLPLVLLFRWATLYRAGENFLTNLLTKVSFFLTNNFILTNLIVFIQS